MGTTTMLAKISLALLALAFAGHASAQDNPGCSSVPPGAVTTLPTPLSQWAAIVCTPYGYIISNHEGWIWSNPGSYSPVFIPSQMVRDNPKPLGAASYFTKIGLAKVSLADDRTKEVLAALQKGYAPDTPKGAYRLEVTGSLGRSLVLYFFDWGTSLNGIWCGSDGADCESDSAFMLLNMRRGS